MAEIECPTPGKHRHGSKRDALLAQESHEREFGIDLSLRPYRCVCGAWHLGHRGKGGSLEARIKRSRRR